MTTFGIRRELETSYEAVLARLPEALKAEGFGVLTEIDVQRTLRQKLGVDFRRYTILGVCNPPFAHQALEAELEAGLLMPCNVVVYETDEGRAVVVAVDPTKSVAAAGHPELGALATSVKEKLVRALARLD